jgi:hypothetical protein
MQLSKLLSGSNFRLYNVDIAKITSVNASIVLGWLAYLCEKHNTDEVFTPHTNISNYTGLTVNEIKTAIKKLEKVDFITVTLKGVPAKNYYQLLDSNIFSYLKSDAPVSEKVTNKIVKKQLTSELKSNPLLKNTNMNTEMNTEMNTKDFFEIFRKEYKGSKKGLETEFKNFKKHNDYKEVLPLLLPALENQIRWKKIELEIDDFTAQWKNLQTWINQRCWEEEPPEKVINVIAQRDKVKNIKNSEVEALYEEFGL